MRLKNLTFNPKHGHTFKDIFKAKSHSKIIQLTCWSVVTVDQLVWTGRSKLKLPVCAAVTLHMGHHPVATTNLLPCLAKLLPKLAGSKARYKKRTFTEVVSYWRRPCRSNSSVITATSSVTSWATTVFLFTPTFNYLSSDSLSVFCTITIKMIGLSEKSALNWTLLRWIFEILELQNQSFRVTMVYP